MKKKLNIVMLVAMSLIVIVLVFIACFNEAQAQSEVAYLCHKHSGTSTDGGGCYENPLTCSGSLLQKSKSIVCSSQGSVQSESEWVCYLHGHVEINSMSGGWYTYPHGERCMQVLGTEIYYECGTCGSIYETPGVCTTLEGYELSCGLEEGTPMVSCQVKRDTTAWCSNLNLKMEVQHLMEGEHNVAWTWGDGSSGETLNVVANGNYSVTIPETEILTGAALSVNVTNIDREGPVIQEVQFSTYEPTTSVTITVIASDTTSGLNYAAYRWDGGNYESQNTKNYSRNGIYSIQVRDGAGNAVFQNIFIENIVDAPAPGVSESVTSELEVSESVTSEPAVSESVTLEPEVSTSEASESDANKNETQENAEHKEDIIGDEAGEMEFPLVRDDGKEAWLLDSTDEPMQENVQEEIAEELQGELTEDAPETLSVEKEEDVSEILSPKSGEDAQLSEENTEKSLLTKDKNSTENRKEVFVTSKNERKSVSTKEVIVFLGICIGISLVFILIFACISGYCTLHKKKKSDKIAMSNY